MLGLMAILTGCPGEGDIDLPERTAQWFPEVSNQHDLIFQHQSGATGELHTPEIMGAGAALLDYDGDGDLDVYLTNGNPSLLQGDSRGGAANRLFRQEDDSTFRDVTAESGLGDEGYGMGVAVGDFDNDGDPDVYVTNYGPDRLYRNRGDGTFEDVTDAAGVAVDGWSASAGWFDYDKDGFLDLFVTRYVDYRADKKCFDAAGRPTYCGPTEFPPVHDVLLHNDGDGTFTDVSDAAGITGVSAGAGLGLICDDLDEDGWIDVYVANDAYANHLWINLGDGTFDERAVVAGAAFNLHGEPEAGMGVVGADLDGDERIDLFVTHLSLETNTFYENLGNGSFVDATGQRGLGQSSMALTGFGTAAFDADLDGDLDLVVANGKVNRAEPREDSWVGEPWSWFAEPNLFYRNDAGTFTALLEPVETLVAPVEVTRGLAAGDFDGDGDVDLLLANIEGPARLYRNDATTGGRWLTVRAVDPRLRRDAIGARVLVHLGGRTMLRSITRSGSYLSSSDPRAFFGLGDTEEIDGIAVRWPDGLVERFPGGTANRHVVLVRGEGEGEGEEAS